MSTFPIPGKPVRIVVPFPPGGAADIQARAMGQKMSEWLGVPIVANDWWTTVSATSA